MDSQELEKEFKEYELSLLALSEQSAQDVGDVLDKMGLKVLANGQVRSMNLAYPMKKHKSAFFTYYQFQAKPEKVKDLDAQLKLKTEILRFLIVTPPIKKVAERSRPVSVDNQIKDQSSKPFEKVEEKLKAAPEILSNELLEQKLEEILQ